MSEILEYIAFGFVLFSFAGAFIMSNDSPSKRDTFIANMLYTFSNLFGFAFMIYNLHWAYILRNGLFLLIGIRGMIKNRRKGKKVVEVNWEEHFAEMIDL